MFSCCAEASADDLEDALAAELEEVVVTASRLSDPVASQAAIELTTEALDVLAPGSIGDAVQQLPGVYLSQPGGRGGVSALSIRGGESNFATVLIDGVQVNDPTNTRGGSFDFSSIDVSDIERMELLRGPAAAVHGSDALSGVLNLVTQTPRDGGRLTLSAGDEDFRRLGAQLGVGSDERGGASISAAKVSDDNRSAGSEYDGEFVRASATALGTNQRLDARLSYADTRQRSFPEDSGGRELAVLADRDQREATEWVGSLSYQNQVSERNRLRLQGSMHRRDELADSPGIAPGPRSPFGVPANRFDTRFERVELTATAEHQRERAQVVGGVQWQREDGDSDGLVAFVGPASFELSRDTISAFVEALARPVGGLTVGGGLRLDKADGVASELTVNLATEFAVADNAAVFARYATGFKLPSFFALASPLVGNPNLEPEEVRSVELGARVQLDGEFGVELVGFDSRYRGLIDFDAATFTNVNRSRARMRGADLSVTGNALSDRLQFRAFASYVDIDLKPGGRLRQRPLWRFGGSLAANVSESVSLNASWQHSAERFDTSVPNPVVDLDSYQRLDLAAHWQAGDSLRLTLAIDNAADERYSDADGFPALGRRVRASAAFSW